MEENRPVAQQVDHLLKCLQTEVVLSEQLLNLGRQQQQALTNHMDENLKDVTAAQDAKLRQLATARKRSGAALNVLISSTGIDPEDVSLIGLASALGEPYSTSLQQMTEKLVEVASDLYRQNAVNKSLLMNAVQYVSFCLRLLSGTDEKVQYGNGSGPNVRPMSLVLDQMV